MDGVIHVEIDARKFPREPFAGEVETDDGRKVTFRERPDIGPDALELVFDGVMQIIEKPWPAISPAPFLCHVSMESLADGRHLQPGPHESLWCRSPIVEIDPSRAGLDRGGVPDARDRAAPRIRYRRGGSPDSGGQRGGRAREVRRGVHARGYDCRVPPAESDRPALGACA